MLFFSVLVAFYFLPTIVAARHGQPVTGMLILNLLLGWTGIGWAILLLRALLVQPRFYVPAAGAYPGDYRYARCGVPPRF